MILTPSCRGLAASARSTHIPSRLTNVASNPKDTKRVARSALELAVVASLREGGRLPHRPVMHIQPHICRWRSGALGRAGALSEVLHLGPERGGAPLRNASEGAPRAPARAAGIPRRGIEGGGGDARPAPPACGGRSMGGEGEDWAEPPCCLGAVEAGPHNYRAPAPARPGRLPGTGVGHPGARAQACGIAESGVGERHLRSVASERHLLARLAHRAAPHPELALTHHQMLVCVRSFVPTHTFPMPPLLQAGSNHLPETRNTSQDSHTPPYVPHMTSFRSVALESSPLLPGTCSACLHDGPNAGNRRGEEERPQSARRYVMTSLTPRCVDGVAAPPSLRPKPQQQRRARLASAHSGPPEVRSNMGAQGSEESPRMFWRGLTRGVRLSRSRAGSTHRLGPRASALPTSARAKRGLVEFRVVRAHLWDKLLLTSTAGWRLTLSPRSLPDALWATRFPA